MNRRMLLAVLMSAAVLPAAATSAAAQSADDFPNRPIRIIVERNQVRCRAFSAGRKEHDLLRNRNEVYAPVGMRLAAQAYG